MFKVCAKCKIEKNWSDYFLRPKWKRPYAYCKICQKEVARISRAKHPETKHNYYLKNKDYINLKKDEWRKKNKDKVSASGKRSYSKHKKKITTHQKKFREKNLYHRREIEKNYSKSLKGKIKSRRRESFKRMAEKKGNFTYKEWTELLKRSKNKCQLCLIKFSKKIIPTIDHIIPITKGGSNNIFNLQPLCKSCNSKKSNKILNLF